MPQLKHKKSVYIGGICGTFMTGIARIARECGYQVHGCDPGCYPPMSDQLAELGIDIDREFVFPTQAYDHYIIGNALSRGNPFVESVLEQGVSFDSGPSWLYRKVLSQRKVLCVAGTHGKTTTSSMLAWILDSAGLAPGFLIGGVPSNFKVSSRLGDSDYFVMEGDEYDTAFFDKRSKFVHYHPFVAILNNLEFDHADIFPNIEAIQLQFHHLMRIIPNNGLVVARANDSALQDVIAQGSWCEVETFGSTDEDADWQMRLLQGQGFELSHRGVVQGVVEWDIPGEHNALNATAAIAAAHKIGIPPTKALQALNSFQGVSRRLEVISTHNDIVVYDDFAHHPTEIKATLTAIKAQCGAGRLLAVMEPRSNSMKRGVHNAQLQDSFACADQAFIYQPPELQWSVKEFVQADSARLHAYTDTDTMVAAILAEARPKDKIVVMSNGDFEGVCTKISQGISQH